MFTAQHFPANRVCRTRIVATVGPACEDASVLVNLIHAGVDVFRLNMAHSKPAEAQIRLDRIRQISRQIRQPVAVLADLGGPKIRLGEIPGGVYDCSPDQPITFVRGDHSSQPHTFATSYETFVDELAVGERVMLADGTVALRVTGKTADSVVCQVVQGGMVRSRQGVNLPGTRLSVRTIQPADIENAKWAVRAGVDFLGLSFVRNAADIRELRAILQQTAAEIPGVNELPQIIAKIEKPEALETLESIVQATDGVMVARGDLGVETDIAAIAVVQKRIIATCRRLRKPVIVATQMLESMTHETIPTRAEVTDVANAILDGADAVMLSGETAVGKHPVLVVQTMNRIATSTEEYHKKTAAINISSFAKPLTESGEPSPDVSDAVCQSAGLLADEIGAKAILTFSHTGRTTLMIASQRHQTMTIGFSPSDAVLRRMCLYYGVIPIMTDKTNGVGADALPEEMLREFVAAGQEAKFFVSGDRIVLAGGAKHTGDTLRYIYIYRV